MENGASSPSPQLCFQLRQPIAEDYEVPVTSPCFNSVFKSFYSVLKVTSGIDPSTPRSNFLSQFSMKESSSRFHLECYKTWDFKVGSGYRNYLNNPCNKVNSRLSRETPAFNERSFDSHSSEKPTASPKALEKATFLRLQTTAPIMTLAVGIQDMENLRQQHDGCRAPDTTDAERLFFTRQTARGQANLRMTTGTGQDGKRTTPFQPDLSTGHRREVRPDVLRVDPETSNRAVNSCSWSHCKVINIRLVLFYSLYTV